VADPQVGQSAPNVERCRATPTQETTVRVGIDVAAPAAVVWDLVTDIHDGATVLPGVAFERLREPDAGGRFGVGLVWAETRTVAGRPHRDVVRVREVDERRSYTVVGDGPDGEAAWTVLRVEPRGEAVCRLALDLHHRPPGRTERLVVALSAPFTAPALRRLVRRDLAALAREAARRHRDAHATTTKE
jgi:carbon monoxide dehydrogenase subunit G